MKISHLKWIVYILLFPIFLACTDVDDTAAVPKEPQLLVQFKMDPTQERLNNLGQPATILAGNAAQSPIFNFISSHYLEFSPNANTPIGQGAILYHAPETTLGGSNAIDFSKAKVVKQGELFLSIPLKNIAVGKYEWVRCSLSYQNYKISILESGTDYTGTLASFVGFNNYITTHTVNGIPFIVNANKSQGYWALNVNGLPFSGQTPAGATTVPNPIASTSPIPSGSCVVTGKFANALQITGKETKDIVLTLSLSVNNSFEWQEVTADGKFEPNAGEQVVDMGLRGLIPSFK